MVLTETANALNVYFNSNDSVTFLTFRVFEEMSKVQVLFDLVFGFECELCFKTNSCGARQMENRHATYQCKLTVSRSLMRCFQRHSGLQTKCFGIFVSFERLCVNTVLFDL